MKPPKLGEFGIRLRSLREQKQLTLSHVARALEISVVYYRDVELGRRRPFSPVKVDYETLAELLGSAADVLLHMAAEERGQLEFDFASADRAERRVALMVARAMGRKKLAPARLREVIRLLKAS